MSLETFYLNNRILIEIIFLFILSIFTIYLFYKTNKVYKFSKYLPIKYFSIAFLLYLLGFIARFFRLLTENTTNTELFFISAFSEQFLTSIAGFYLLFSLIYKNHSKFLNHIIASTFYFLFFILSIVSVYTSIRYYTFIPQIIFFSYASVITFNNYLQNRKQVSKLFFITMILNLVGWISYTFAWAFLVRLNDYLYGTVFMFTNIVTISILIILAYILNKHLSKF